MAISYITFKLCTDFYNWFFQGIRNILALGGDHSYVIKPEDEATFKDDPKLRYASDLVRQIRNEWGSEFTVCVAGYPQVGSVWTDLVNWDPSWPDQQCFRLCQYGLWSFQTGDTKLKYGFCKKSLRKNATLNSWTLSSSQKGTCSNES